MLRICWTEYTPWQNIGVQCTIGAVRKNGGWPNTGTGREDVRLVMTDGEINRRKVFPW